jgi:hypothetical protein
MRMPPPAATAVAALRLPSTGLLLRLLLLPPTRLLL